MTWNFLVADSEPADAREERRASVGLSAGETFATVIDAMQPDARIDRVTPADADAALPDGAALAGYDAVFLSGSPLHLYRSTPAVDRYVGFMRAIFAAGTPSFGSCAGLQVATVAAGGSVRPMEHRREAGFARRITATAEGRDHPLLRDRPAAWDAPAIHGDEVEQLPAGATLLAANAACPVQAAEIRHDAGVFWGVQYHPELAIAEIAAALRRQADTLIEDGLAHSPEDVEAQAALIDALAADPGRADLAWRLGVDREITDDARRRRDIRNFLDHLVGPVRAERGRG